MTKFETFVSGVMLWVARIALAALSFAGCVYFLGGVDRMILYPLSVLLVAFLLKETL